MKDYNLTQKQLDVYRYVRGYIHRYNRSPYIREIQEACGINSYKIALDRLSSLEKKGYIRRHLNKHRSIELNKV
jgi:repressor LexA